VHSAYYALSDKDWFIIGAFGFNVSLDGANLLFWPVDPDAVTRKLAELNAASNGAGPVSQQTVRAYPPPQPSVTAPIPQAPSSQPGVIPPMPPVPGPRKSPPPFQPQAAAPALPIPPPPPSQSGMRSRRVSSEAQAAMHRDEYADEGMSRPSSAGAP